MYGKLNFNKILFIGTFPSLKSGSLDVSETIAYLLKNEGFNIKITSKYENKFLRLTKIIFDFIVFNPSIIHINVFSGQAFFVSEIGVFLGFIFKKKVILTLHGGGLADFEKQNSQRIKMVFDKVDYIQSPSIFLKNYFVSKGFEIHYLPNPIVETNFPFFKRRDFNCKLLWVRAFSHIYNPDLAIKTLYEVVKVFPNATLSMVGPNKGILNQCMELANQLGLSDKIDFIGPVANTELKDFYQTHDIFLNTTQYESFGLAVIEAASCGIPIVSTSVGEIPYLWKNEFDIMLVESFSQIEMANQVIKLLENDELYHFLSNNARYTANQFSWDKVKPKWIELLNRIIRK
jgi:glycosyltransferase involved in cell wall biosynthesis